MRIRRALRMYGLAVAGVVGAGVVLGSAMAHADCTPASNLVAPHTRPTWSQGGVVYDTSTDQLKTCDGTNYTTISGSSSTPDRIVSGSHSVIANTNTGYVSLTNGNTVYGYLGQSATYLPTLVAANLSTTANASVTTLYASNKVSIGGTTQHDNLTLQTASVGSIFPLRIFNNEGTVGNATGMAFKVTANTSDQYYKGGIVFQRTAGLGGRGQLHFLLNGVNDTSNVSLTTDTRMTLDYSGNVGIGSSNPTTSLTVVGEVQVSNSGVSCSSSTQGAIRYTSGNLQYCNGSSFTALSSATTNVSALDDLTDAATEYTTSYTFFVGDNAGVSSKGDYVTGVGVNAAYLNNGNNVVGLGMSAAYQSSGSYVTAAGYGAAAYNSGTHVTGVGYNAARQNTVNYVTGVGHAAAYLNTGMYVTGLGYFAAYQNTGAAVTALGHSAASQNTGNYVTGVGVNAAYQNTAANVVAIGYEAGKNNATANQFIVKQSPVNATPLMQGDFGTGNLGIGTTSPSARLDVVSSTAGVAIARFQNGTGACTFTPASSGSGTWSCSSDARLKTDITDAEGRALDWVKDFRIRDYTVKADGSRQTGVIAQEVARTHPEMVHTGADGMLTVDEPGVWKLVQAIQELRADNDNLRRDLDALKRSLGR